VIARSCGIAELSGVVLFLLLQQLLGFCSSVRDDLQTMMLLCRKKADNLKIQMGASVEEVL
jgi:hypothetical protein